MSGRAANADRIAVDWGATCLRARALAADGTVLDAARPCWLGGEGALVGAPEPAGVYATAFARKGLAPSCVEGAEMTRTGLGAFRARLSEAVR